MNELNTADAGRSDSHVDTVGLRQYYFIVHIETDSFC